MKNLVTHLLAGYGTIENFGLGSRTVQSRTLYEGQRVVGVPWPSEKGEGTWQQYVAVPLKHLVKARYDQVMFAAWQL